MCIFWLKKTVARNLRESIKEFWKNCGFLKERLLHDRNWIKNGEPYNFKCIKITKNLLKNVCLFLSFPFSFIFFMNTKLPTKICITTFQEKGRHELQRQKVKEEDNKSLKRRKTRKSDCTIWKFRQKWGEFIRNERFIKKLRQFSQK